MPVTYISDSGVLSGHSSASKRTAPTPYSAQTKVKPKVQYSEPGKRPPYPHVRLTCNGDSSDGYDSCIMMPKDRDSERSREEVVNLEAMIMQESPLCHLVREFHKGHRNTEDRAVQETSGRSENDRANTTKFGLNESNEGSSTEPRNRGSYSHSLDRNKQEVSASPQNSRNHLSKDKVATSHPRRQSKSGKGITSIDYNFQEGGQSSSTNHVPRPSSRDSASQESECAVSVMNIDLSSYIQPSTASSKNVLKKKRPTRAS